MKKQEIVAGGIVAGFVGLILAVMVPYINHLIWGSPEEEG